MDSSWLLWQLADSGLPTGGFVASSGLEAALATGLVAGSPDGVRLFVRESVKSYAMSAGPFVAAAHRLCRKANEDCDGRDRTLQAALDLDDEYDTSTGNAVARRASAAQGGALLSLWSKSFKMDDKDCGRSEVIGEENPGIERTRRLNVLIQDFKAECRKGTVVGHVPVCFGLLCGYLDLSLGSFLAYGLASFN